MIVLLVVSVDSAVISVLCVLVNCFNACEPPVQCRQHVTCDHADSSDAVRAWVSVQASEPLKKNRGAGTRYLVHV